MLNLDAERQAQQPWWFVVQAAAGDSPAVEVEFVPIGRAALRAARRAAAEAVGAAMSEDEDESATLSPELVEIAGDVLSEHLLLTGIRAWRGVGDAEGALAPVTPDNLRLFLADPIVAMIKVYLEERSKALKARNDARLMRPADS